MTFAPAAPRRWPVVRALAAIVLVCLAQVALVSFLEDPSPVIPRPADGAPLLHFAGDRSAEWLALTDPTLFALPHLQDFSGEAWLKIRRPNFRLTDWPAPTRCLALDVPQLGMGFENFLAGPSFPDYQAVVPPKPELSPSEMDSVLPVSREAKLRIEGALSRRRLISFPEFPALNPPELDLNADFLTNSVIQVLVDAAGKPISAVRLSGTGSGSDRVDRLALELAKEARFEPLKTPGKAPWVDPFAGVTIGILIFDWPTMLARSAHVPAANP